MKFERCVFTKAPRARTPRQIRNAEKHVARQFAECPLFPELVKEKTAAERIANLDASEARWVKQIRQGTADAWKKVRSTLQAMPANSKAGWLKYWATTYGPKDAYRFADLLHCHRKQSPWSLLRFNHQLRLIGAKKLDRCHLNEFYV